ncbi:monoamine oxidase [Caloramator quimbayensis]|uniref:Monoamine oxidase n=1 Tax=Caloramator quimbayensis TaxID=1147123 RepID=A0A1T4XFG4_9CLOT|nr:FAD-dependent oxidoreductase [Caloramator quimbayensis]SKA87795.1 monoamine oxidase [Caloramator quimbayensis]
MNKNIVPYQRDNPTDEERFLQLKYLLNQSGREEDFCNIIELLSPPKNIETIVPKGCGNGVSVAVIGAGLSGLCTAYELRKIGCDITIFEASNRIGGRVNTIYFDREKQYFGEVGAMRIGVSHETTWHYINHFKLKTRPFASKNINGLFYIRGSYARNDSQGKSVKENIYPKYNLTEEERKTPWQKLSEKIVNKYLNSLSPKIRREFIEIKKNYSEPIKNIDSITLRKAYENLRLSQDAISMIGFLSAFEESFLNIGLTEILQEAYTADFGFTYYIDGGMIKLAEKFYMELNNQNIGRVAFRFNSIVDGIYKDDRGKIILEIREGCKNKYFKAFDVVICAIPFSSLRRVTVVPPFSVLKSQAIAELNYGYAQKTLLFLKERFWEYGGEDKRIVGGSSLTDLIPISIFYPSDNSVPIEGVYNGWTFKGVLPSKKPGVLLASYNWGNNALRLGNENCCLRLDDVVESVEKVHKLYRGYIYRNLLSWQSISWANIEYIWGGGCLPFSGQKTLFSYEITRPEMDNRVFFAGEHVSQKHVWMQGALQSGMIAANEAAKFICKNNIRHSK